MNEMMSLMEVNKESILNQSYKGYLKMKDDHYRSKIEETLNVKSSFHHSNRDPVMSPVKHKQMSNLLRAI